MVHKGQTERPNRQHKTEDDSLMMGYLSHSDKREDSSLYHFTFAQSNNSKVSC